MEVVDFLEDSLGSSLLSALFILAALFLWKSFFFTDLSTRDIALRIFSFFLLFLARRIAISSLALKVLFSFSFLLETLKALLAVFVTGIDVLWLVRSVIFESILLPYSLPTG